MFFPDFIKLSWNPMGKHNDIYRLNNLLFLSLLYVCLEGMSLSLWHGRVQEACQILLKSVGLVFCIIITISIL